MGMIGRRFALALGLLLAVVTSQLPEFVQQYRQRLGGALDEVRQVIAAFDSEAQAQALSREAGIARLETNPDPLAQARGAGSRSGGRSRAAARGAGARLRRGRPGVAILGVRLRTRSDACQPHLRDFPAGAAGLDCGFRGGARGPRPRLGRSSCRAGAVPAPAAQQYDRGLTGIGLARPKYERLGSQEICALSAQICEAPDDPTFACDLSSLRNDGGSPGADPAAIADGACGRNRAAGPKEVGRRWHLSARPDQADHRR